MRMTRIYDGRTLGEFQSGRAFFIRATFEADDGTNYQGFVDGDNYRFIRLQNTPRGTVKHYLVPRKSKLEKCFLELIEKHDDPVLRWKNDQ